MSSPQMIQLERPAMACRFGITVVGDDPELLQQAAEDALDEIERIESLLSMYDPDSILSGINRAAAAGPTGVLSEVFELLLLAGTIWEETDGAFDPTMGPLVRLWRGWRADGTPPDPAAIDEVRQRVGMNHVEFDVPGRSIRFDRPDVEIDLGAIGKGYAVDQAAEVLDEHGIEHFLVHGGTSTIAAQGSMDAGADGWRLGIADPSDPDGIAEVITLRDEACACSNQLNQFYEHNGRQLGHVIDPRTGWPAPAESSILVVCTSATRADALSTALLVLGNEAVEQVNQTFGGVRAYCLSGGAEPRTDGLDSTGVVRSDGSAARNSVKNGQGTQNPTTVGGQGADE